MTLMSQILKAFRAMSDEEVEEILLESIDCHLAHATGEPCPSVLTNEEEAIFEAMGFPSDKEEANK